MPRVTILTLLECTLALLTCSCKGQRGARSVEEIAAEIVIATPDTSIYARVKAFTADSLIVVQDHKEQAVSYAMATGTYANGNNVHANGNGTYATTNSNGDAPTIIVGTLREGDRVALVVNGKTHNVQHIVNITQMTGQWFYDMDAQRGFTLTAAGSLSPINPDDVCLRRWKLNNGRLIIYYTPAEDVARNSRNYLTDTTTIDALSDQEMVFAFRGNTLHCRRKTEPIKVEFKF